MSRRMLRKRKLQQTAIFDTIREGNVKRIVLYSWYDPGQGAVERRRLETPRKESVKGKMKVLLRLKNRTPARQLEPHRGKRKRLYEEETIIWSSEE